METPAESNSGVRSEAEIESLLTVYREVFPEEYHYIQEYLDYGINPLDTVPDLVFEKMRSLEETDYTLYVYSNRQILIVVSSEPQMKEPVAIKKDTSNDTRGAGLQTKYRQIQLGDLGYYVAFYVKYYIDTAAYDAIDLNPSDTYGMGSWIPSSLRNCMKIHPAAHITYFEMLIA